MPPFLLLPPSPAEESAARYATILALAGIYFGIFGLMLTAGFGSAYWSAAVSIWAIGWVFIVWAFHEARQAD